MDWRGRCLFEIGWPLFFAVHIGNEDEMAASVTPIQFGAITTAGRGCVAVSSYTSAPLKMVVPSAYRTGSTFMLPLPLDYDSCAVRLRLRRMSTTITTAPQNIGDRQAASAKNSPSLITETSHGRKSS